MLKATTIRIAALYLPLSTAVAAGFLRKRRPRQLAACLLSFLWTLPTLLILQRLNPIPPPIMLRFASGAAMQQFTPPSGWWSFAPTHFSILTMPIEIYLGWAILWGLVPQLLFHCIDPPEIIVLLASLDAWTMFLCRPVLILKQNWLVGEAVALAIVLLPALYIARWTFDDTNLNLRAAMQVILSGLLFLFLIPEITFALRPGPGWSPLWKMPHWQLQISIQIILLIAVFGVSAVEEFAQRGFGTPLPYDPPKRLVASGVYRYCANPMQVSCAVVMLLWAGMLHNIWLVAAATMSTLYSAGIAMWDESQDLPARLGEPWRQYQAAVPSWRLRLRPYHSGPSARLYIASTCGPCSEIRSFLAARHPLGLNLIDAETLPPGSINRLRYDPADGTPSVEGIRAFARALEHLNLAWAYCGFTLRLPIVWQAMQLLMDASGLGPRVLPASAATEKP